MKYRRSFGAYSWGGHGIINNQLELTWFLYSSLLLLILAVRGMLYCNGIAWFQIAFPPGEYAQYRDGFERNNRNGCASHTICFIFKIRSCNNKYNSNYNNNFKTIITASPQTDFSGRMPLPRRKIGTQLLAQNSNKFPENPYNKQTRRTNENNVKIHLVYKLPEFAIFIENKRWREWEKQQQQQLGHT